MSVTCGHDRPHGGRGLCNPCYQKALRAGRLHEHPLTCKRISRAELVEEWHHLRELGLDRDEIAAKLGMTPKSLQTSLRRAGVRE